MPFLITDAYLTSRVNIDKNAGAIAMKIAMQDVTEYHVKDLLSIPLYEFYLDHVTNNTALTPKQAELFEKVKIYFAKMVQYEMSHNLFDIKAKGNQVEDGAPNIELIKMKRAEIFSKAEQMKANILKYLGQNKSDFPQYFSEDEQPTQAAGPSSGVSPIVFLNEPKIWIGG